MGGIVPRIAKGAAMPRIEPAFQIHASRTRAWRFSAGLAGCYPHSRSGWVGQIGGFQPFSKGAPRTRNITSCIAKEAIRQTGLNDSGGHPAELVPLFSYPLAPQPILRLVGTRLYDVPSGHKSLPFVNSTDSKSIIWIA